MGFNPRPRVGGDPAGLRPAQVVRVSIHAPAWGATREGDDAAIHDLVSIHAPAWGATGFPIWLRVAILFQSTPPRGGRRLKDNR